MSVLEFHRGIRKNIMQVWNGFRSVPPWNRPKSVPHFRKRTGRAFFFLCLLPIALSIFPACSRRMQLESAQHAWDGGDYTKAVEFYEQFLKSSPRHEKAAFARYQAATIYRRDLKQCERAIPHYIHLIEDFPSSPDVYNSRMFLAECYGKTDKPREAISEYENLLPFTTDEKEKRRIRIHIAELYYKMNDYGQAIAEY